MMAVEGSMWWLRRRSCEDMCQRAIVSWRLAVDGSYSKEASKQATNSHHIAADKLDVCPGGVQTGR